MNALLTIPSSAAVMTAALEGLARVDEEILARRPDLPSIYDGGVEYREEPRETWRHVADVVKDGWGDCEDLAAARAAELRATGEDPDAAPHVYRSGPRRYHAVVKRGDGTLEDPSRALGMGRKKGIVMHNRGEVVLGADPSPGTAEITWDVEKTPNGWRGHARVPLADGRALFARGPVVAKKDDAVKSAINIAQKALDSPAAQALLPAPAKFALNVIKSKTARNIAKKILSFF